MSETGGWFAIRVTWGCFDGKDESIVVVVIGLPNFRKLKIILYNEKQFSDFVRHLVINLFINSFTAYYHKCDVK